MKIVFLLLSLFQLTSVFSQVRTASFTCCQKIDIPDDVIIIEDSPEFIVTPDEGIEFDATTDNTSFIRIYGRWGNLVFEQQNPGTNFSWNGRTNKGRLLPEGTYYYFIIQKDPQTGLEQLESGFITMLN